MQSQTLSSFTFMVWDHTARGVRMGCVRVEDDDRMLFIVSYDCPANGRRLFVGAPWVADPLHHEQGRALASEGVVNQFLSDVGASSLQAAGPSRQRGCLMDFWRSISQWRCS